jgi:RHH-type proline utilization regulon transcriptional repressor/proline dehydrogenase/delta 1-pyrroline-5-carboxylate dehydrogenase
MSLRDLMIQVGFSKENVDVYFVKSNELKHALNSAKLSVIIYDGVMEQFEEHIGKFLDDGKNDFRMKLILTKADHLKAQDFYHQAMNFVWVRSLAINTMRHGAPLDLDF